MSPWTALLQSLHSALIDEVTDRHPEPKPELGFPKKQSQFQFPAPNVLWIKTSFPRNPLGQCYAFQPEFLKTSNSMPFNSGNCISNVRAPSLLAANLPSFGKPTEFKYGCPIELSFLPTDRLDSYQLFPRVDAGLGSPLSFSIKNQKYIKTPNCHVTDRTWFRTSS